jgi:hypothetical protein
LRRLVERFASQLVEEENKKTKKAVQREKIFIIAMLLEKDFVETNMFEKAVKDRFFLRYFKMFLIWGSSGA